MMQEVERLPSPGLPRPRAPPPPLPPNAAAVPSSSVQLVDGASLSDVLLRQRWAVHWMSRLFHFRRPELHAYAHELVKFLREEALAGFRRAFGYRVSIRHTRAFVAVDVVEEREAKDADLVAPSARSRAQTLEPPGRPPRAGGAGARKTASSVGYDSRDSVSAAGANTSFLKAAAAAAREGGRTIDEAPTTTLLARRGSFVLYFSEQEEDEAAQRHSMLQRRTKERQYVVLLRGDEGLLGWACAWLQQRFQCIVSDRQMRISPLNLKWLARNWVVDVLAGNGASSDGDTGADDAPRAKQPLLLQYQNLDAKSMVRQYTLTVPWATLKRLWSQAEPAPSDRSATPELVQMTEDLYFETLPLNMAAFELERISMADASVDKNGHLEFHSMALVRSVLRDLADLLCIQNVPGPANPVMTL